jgi:hypothetical protein
MKTQKNHIRIMSENRESIITICLVVGLILFLVTYWFGGQREADNAKDALVRWTQEAVVIEKTNHWWGTSCLLNADDGKRYYDENCEQYANNDKVIITMYKEHYSWIQGLA